MQRFPLLGRRLLALFVDYLILSSVNFLLQPLLLISYIIAASPMADGGLRNSMLLSLLLGGQLLPVLVYFWLFHASHWHATPGKLLVGIELREAGPQPLGIGAMAMRSLYALTLLSAGSGYLWALVDRRGRALHDWLGASVIVRRGTDPMFAIPAASLEPSTAILYVIASYLMYAIAMIPCALVFNAILR
jgi:uncharacterized RDD family membrane protein YckC